jgi:hypothetical protein
MSALTVTATQGGTGTANGMALTVKVLTGTTTVQNGATVSSAAITLPQDSITPHATGSLVYGALSSGVSSAAFGSILASTTFSQNISDATNAAAYGTFRSAATTTASSGVTLGAGTPSGSAGQLDIALAEILTSGTLAEDSSAPAGASTTTATTLATASFIPPPGSLLVAMVGSDYAGSGTLTMSVSGGGLTWTQAAGTTVNTASVWLAQVPGVPPAQPAAPGASWRQFFRHPQQPFQPPPAAVTLTASAAADAVASATASATTTHMAAAAADAVATTVASGTTTHMASASLDAVAVSTASATAGAPTVSISGETDVVATTTATGTTTHKAAASLDVVADRAAAGVGTHKASAVRDVVADRTAAASAGTATPTLVQQVIGGDESDYGFSSTDMVTTGGNGLVMFAGWDLHNAPTTAPVPALYPADSAGNYWYHLGTSPVGGYGSRCTIWACPNARSIEWVSACMTAYANSMVFTVCEIENFPQFCEVDVSASSFVNSGIPSEQVFSTPGPFTWQAPPGVSTVDTEATGAGGTGGSTAAARQQGGGGGGGEYAAEPSLAVTAGNVYSGTVGAPAAVVAAGTPGVSGSSTFTGDSATVTAHGGHGGVGGALTGAGGSPGSGSSNTDHNPGGTGGTGNNSGDGAGGGGAGSAGSGSAGGSAPTAPGAGSAGTGSTPGANGGQGDPAGGAGPGSPGLSPGGGGGGSSSVDYAHPGGLGGAGQVKLTWNVSSPTSLTVSGTTTSADIGFSLIAAGAGDMLLTSAPSGWSNLGSGVTIGGASPDGMTIFPYWKSSITSGTNLSTSYTVSPEIAISSVLATIQAAPAAPVQPNPNFPVLKVEIAEGFTPGDPTAAPPSWTDITARCIGKDGGSFITTGYGQQYELATPEAGEMVIGVLNNDGAFTPGNVASPYYPYIVLGMPVRVSAYWDGSWYQVGFGYVERWPQEWPDLPQWGLSMLTCTDSIAVLTSTTMPSALQGDILADAPYSYILCGEQYLNTVNGLTSASGPLYSYTSAECAGLIAANASRVNQKAAMYCDGTGTQAEALETGDALNLLGDQGTGVGTSAISGSIVYNTNVTGPGVIYNDPDMPDPTGADGVSVEFWFVYDFTETSGQGLTLLQAFTGPSAYWPTNNTSFSTAAPASFGVVLNSSSNTVVLTLNSSTGTTVGSFTPSSDPQQIVVVFPPSGSDALNVYLNGALLGTVSLTGGQTTAWNAMALGPCNYAYTANPLVQNYVAGHWAIFPYALSAGRIAAHYATGAQGAGGVTVSQGAAQILSWGYLGLPHGGPSQFNGASDGIEMGPFYSLAGSSASDGLNGLILSDGGMMYAAPSGILTILPRWALFNQSPSVTFGDSVTAGQVPFLEGQAFDYDNTYLYNVVQVTRDDGTLTSITAQVKNSPSQLAYFTRSALQQTISTTSDLDAYTLANWESGEYAQPAVRVRTLTVDAASNPAVAFPAILPTVVSNVAGVQRTPVGGVPIIGTYLVQKVTHTIGPTSWHVDYQLSPYVQPSTVLALDTASYNVLGNNTLA